MDYAMVALKIIGIGSILLFALVLLWLGWRELLVFHRADQSPTSAEAAKDPAA